MVAPQRGEHSENETVGNMRKLFWAFPAFVVTAAAALLMAFAGRSQSYKPIPAAPARFAYDQIEISRFFLPGEKTTDSPPGSFERDYHWAVTRSGDYDHRYATMHHIAYFDGWTRVETAESIQLANRQRKIVIIADKESAMFRRYTGSQAQAMLTPDRRSQYGTVASTAIVASPGTAVYNVSDKFYFLPAIPLGGIEALGRRTSETTVASEPKGSCASGRFSLQGYRALSVTTEYRAPFAEPKDPPFHLRRADTGIVNLCRVRVVRPTQSVAQRWFDNHFLLYKREENSTIEHGKANIWNVDIMERGHIHALSENDRTLFSLSGRYVDGCSRRPVPSDCEPLANYAKLSAAVVFSHVNGGFFGVIQSRDGSIWFCETARDRLGRVGNDNTVHEVTLPPGTMPEQLTEAPDGTIWFTEAGFGVVGGRHSGVGSYGPSGEISEPVKFKPGQSIGGIDAAKDGSVWFSYGNNDAAVGQITGTGPLRRFPLASGSLPSGVRLGPDGAVWAAEYGAGVIARLAPPGPVTRFHVSTEKDPSGPFGLAFGRSVLWFTSEFNVGYLDANNQSHIFTVQRNDGSTGEIVELPNGDAAFTEDVGRIGIVSPQGEFVEFAVPGQPDDLLLDREGNLWYTDRNSVRVIRNFLQVTRSATQILNPV
jgi:streptogramin lyase